MSNNYYFYLVFFSQIFFVSGYLPYRILNRIKKIKRSYPSTEYPKLYPKSDDYYEKVQRNYRAMNQFLFVLGVGVFYLILSQEIFPKGNISQWLPWGYFMLQMLPMVYLEKLELSNFKNMKLKNTDTTRTAMLNPRRLTDYVSFKIVIVSVFTYATTLFTAFYLYHLDSKAIQMSVILTLVNLLFAVTVLFSLRAKKIDPHLCEDDLTRIKKTMLTSLFYVNIGISLFFAIILVVDKYELDFLQPVVMSIYTQAIVMVSFIPRLNALKLKDIDFDVYKEKLSR